jgi:hypothetical protein
MTIGDDIFYWPLGGDTVPPDVSRVRKAARVQPDGRQRAYLLGSNLYVSDVAGHERALTTDGTARVLNGKLDWVWGKSSAAAGRVLVERTPRGSHFSRSTTPVPSFPVVDHPAGGPRATPYPRSGDPNPLVKIGVVRAGGSQVQWFDLPIQRRGSPHRRGRLDADSKQVIFQVQNREQSWLDRLRGVTGGDVKTLFRETTGVVNNMGSPTWLKDGSFLWFSERSGQHLYHYKRDGTLIKQLTEASGRPAPSMAWTRQMNGSAAGTERSSIGGNVPRQVDGSGLARLADGRNQQRQLQRR